MYYIKNKTNGWRSEERYHTQSDAAMAMSALIDKVAHTALENSLYKPQFVIMEEPINEEIDIEDYPIIRA